MNRRVLGVLSVLLLTAVSIWLVRQGGPVVPRTAQAPRHTPDAIIATFTSTYLNESGVPDYQLHADRMVHFPDDDTAELTEPRLVVFRPGAPPWHLSAGHGWVSGDGQTVLLSQGVRISRTDPQRGTVEVISDDMRVRPKEDYAETASQVTMNGPTSVVRAVGFQAFMAEQRLVLLSEVRGHYEPPAP